MENNKFQKGNIFKSILKAKEFGIFIGLIILFMIFAFSTPQNFLQISNILSILRQVSFVGLMAIGMTMVIVSGEFDLSVGSIYGMAVMVGALLIRNGLNAWLSVIIALLCGALVGAINGLLVTYGRIPSFIVTLGMLNIIRGFNQLITGGEFVNIAPIRNTNLEILRFIGAGRLFNVLPVSGLVFVVIALIAGTIYHKSIVGLHIRSVGGNSVAAMLSGIKVKKIKILAFIISGFTAAFSGLLSLFLLNGARSYAGTGLELNVIAATVIGGTSLMGGIGSMLGTVIGVLIVGILEAGMVLLGMPPFSQIMFIGFVIITAVAIDIWTGEKKIQSMGKDKKVH